MQINLILNGTKVSVDVAADTLLLDLVRSQGCASVKRGCETSNCGLCTVFLEDKPVLSAPFWLPVPMANGSRHWRACRKKPRSLVHSLRTRAQSSAASATRALS